MPASIRRANGRKSAVRSHIEHAFAEQQNEPLHPNHRNRLGRIKIGLTDLVYNIKRFIWSERTAAELTAPSLQRG